jgi:hypothetical protein
MTKMVYELIFHVDAENRHSRLANEKSLAAQSKKLVLRMLLPSSFTATHFIPLALLSGAR